MGPIRNIFACLVHESQDCVVDLTRNLRTLDPNSLVLLYNGGRDPELLGDRFPFERLGAVIHPSPRPLAWGHLHPFALDCMKWALENHPFDTLTIVDSDQLAIRPGYSEYLGAHLKTIPGVGVLGSSAAVHAPGTRVGPAEAALRERALWQPLLRSFPDGDAKFVHWCFWPSTVFTADVARELTELFDTNSMLQDIMRQTRIWATEEVILPTLAAMLGYGIGASPCTFDYVGYRSSFTPRQIEQAFDRPDAYWVHPVARRYDDPLRRRIRERWNHYEPARPAAMVAEAEFPPLLLTMPVLEQIRGIEGWLDNTEADLLLAAVSRTIATVPDGEIVEVGSYCGKSTIVLGAALNTLGNPNGIKIHAIDPHDGIVGALDQGIQHLAPTRDRFLRNIEKAGISHLIEPVAQRSFEVEWNKPIAFLFIDGLHDYFNVARDFFHFEQWIVRGGFVVFHDYAEYYPGVKTFVDELVAGGRYRKVHRTLSMIVLRAEEERPAAAVVPVVKVAAPSVVSAAPLVSCIMPTANRRRFVPQAIRYFQRQDYANRELVVLDDGEQDVADLIPPDPRIRYERRTGRSTMGAKHNLGCELARGNIIVHWDDDDWMADWRLSYQTTAILAQPVHTLCGLPRLYFYDPAGLRAWEYVYPNSDRPWVSGGTFCYYREFWQSHRFPDMSEGADTVFVWGLHDAAVCAHERRDFYVAIVHPTNTSRKRTLDPAWHPVSVQTIHGLMETDQGFYDGLAGVGDR